MQWHSQHPSNLDHRVLNSHSAAWPALALSVLELAASPSNQALRADRVSDPQQLRDLNVQRTVNAGIDQQLCDRLKSGLECVYSGPIVLQQIETYFSALHL